MGLNFQERKFIVTGAATGIGKAAAEELMAHGASVALWDIDRPTCQAIADKATGKQTVIAVEVDVASAASVEAGMAKTVEALGGVDGAFNNAGIGLPTVPTEMIEEADFDRIVSVNMKGVWLCMKSQLLYMKANGGGAIVNNASVAGLVGLAMQGAYSGTKHAVIGMTKAAALEAAPEKVRVNAICPGATHTPILQHLLEAGITEEMLGEMAAQKRLAQPDEIAAAACWLLSDAASFVTGTAMPVDGGWTAH
ncbi:MAG: SDR family NAD(P)-dependent oxidoreductase [Parvularculales bacterium]